MRQQTFFAPSLMLAVGFAQASDTARHEVQAMEKAKMSLTEAIRAAERQGNGQANNQGRYHDCKGEGGKEGGTARSSSRSPGGPAYRLRFHIA